MRADHLVAGRPVGVQALDVGEHHELLRTEGDGERRGGGVGVDVVDRAVGAAGDRRDHGHEAVVEQLLDEVRAHLDDVADEADVDRLAVDEHVAPLGGEQVRVLAGQPDGVGTVGVEQPDDLALHLAGQHHAYDVHRLRAGHAVAAAELALDAEPVEHPADLRPAAVDDDRAQTRPSAGT